MCGMWFEQTEGEILATEEKRRRLKRDLELQMLEKERRRRTEAEESLRWEKNFGFSSDSLPWLTDSTLSSSQNEIDHQAITAQEKGAEASAEVKEQRNEAVASSGSKLNSTHQVKSCLTSRKRSYDALF